MHRQLLSAFAIGGSVVAVVAVIARLLQRRREQPPPPLCDLSKFQLLLAEEIEVEAYRDAVIHWANIQAQRPGLPAIFQTFIDIDYAPFPNIDGFSFRNWGLLFSVFNFEVAQDMDVSDIYDRYIVWAANKRFDALTLDEGPDHGLLDD